MGEQIKWLRDGQTIYSLMHNGWRKGEETFRNRFYFHVYADGECAPAEVEIVVAGIYAALNNAAEIAAQADARIAELEDVIKEIINCPHGVDAATVPRNGIEASPSQVVLQYSIGYARIERARKLLNQE